MARTTFRLRCDAGIDAFAAQECREGLERLYGSDLWREDAEWTVSLSRKPDLPPEGYRLSGAPGSISVEAADDRGLLYGVYAFLRRAALGEEFSALKETAVPAAARRMLDHWDNVDGSIERGYAGASLFFRDGRLSYDPERIKDYARLLASVGVNHISLNNVNVRGGALRLITDDMLPEVAALAGLLRPFGLRLILSVHFDSPMLLGGLSTADPCDTKVSAWWQETAERVYRYIPDLSGFLVKADSEFQNGPASFGRTQADGANTIARALSPYGGMVFWRCFVYLCTQDWRDTVTDRPMAAYDHFHSLDGRFDDNVMLQIKNGPMDFQPREPLSPLFGAMPRTRQALEVQLTQEYTGQQIDLYALPVQWQEIFSSPITGERVLRDLIGQEVGGVSGVANVGDEENWTGHTLAQCNLYAFGRMAWDPSLTARQIVEEWVKLTFGRDPRLTEPLIAMMLSSRNTYEKYTAPLGIGWMVNISHHYGPNVEGYEYSPWGTYHRADWQAIGIDRTRGGTGYAAQYHPDVERLYSDLTTCPEELLLFFHRLPYTYPLQNGKTLLQHIYDTHFEGVEEVRGFVKTWESLRELLPESAYESVARKLALQLANAREWRDVVNTYFYRKTGKPDEHGRPIHK